MLPIRLKNPSLNSQRKIRKPVREYDDIGIIKYFDKHLYTYLCLVQCCRIELEGHNLPSIVLKFEWTDENLPFIDIPFFKYQNFQTKEHVFPKEREIDFWDHLVTNLNSSKGTSSHSNLVLHLFIL